LEQPETGQPASTLQNNDDKTDAISLLFDIPIDLRRKAQRLVLRTI
jgi:hypothetical protein